MIEIAVVLLVLATLPATCELILITLGVLFYRTKPLPILRSPFPKTVVVVPAHNEATHIKKTVQSIQKCKGSFDCVVLADNCTDNTAEIVRGEQVQVLERYSDERGKHHALRFAFASITDYELYIIVDADSIVEPNLVEVFQAHLQEGAEAIQALYLLPPSGDYLSSRLASIAFTAFNALRPMARSTWDLSCGIFGNGFGISKTIREKFPIPTDTIAEDVAYHQKLVQAGIKVVFAPETTVTAESPPSIKDASDQQQRWQGGRLRLWREKTPILFKELLKGNWLCLEPLLDLFTPPLAYYCPLLLILLFTSFKGYALLALFVLAVHVVQTLRYRNLGLADWSALAQVPFYLLRKWADVPQLLKSSKKDGTWTRTKRKGE